MPRNIVILTGAGVSQESGIPTFRDLDGIWATVNIEDVATPEAFARNPDRVHAFYNARRLDLVSRDIQPNAAHHAIAKLEADWPHGEVLLVTQNIDDLHRRAGSRNVIHMHGELLKARCTHCWGLQDCREELSTNTPCPGCQKTGEAETGTGMRPHVVWFGEVPYEMDRIQEALSQCELFISIGTSGNVYPASGFVSLANSTGARTVELNLEPSQGASLFDEAIHGPATQVVPAFVDQLLAEAL